MRQQKLPQTFWGLSMPAGSGRVLFSLIILVGLVGCNEAASTPPVTSVTVHADNLIYQELGVPESPWYGTLRQAGKVHKLVFGETQQELYLGGFQRSLEPLIGAKVTVTGKLAEAEGVMALWPAIIKVHTDGLLACSKATPQAPLEEKISPYLKNLIAEGLVEQLESVSVSVCDDQIITPDSTEAQLDTLRASAYALLTQELAPLNVEIQGTSWLAGGFDANIPLESVLKVAERADVLYINSNNETAPPP